MTEKQRKCIEDGVKDLVLKDGQAIDAIAKYCEVDQNIVYAFYLQFHREIFNSMKSSAVVHQVIGS